MAEAFAIATPNVGAASSSQKRKHKRRGRWQASQDIDVTRKIIRKCERLRPRGRQAKAAPMSAGTPSTPHPDTASI
ncbi:MAG: hypothetical protein WBE48_12500, partial [Xanthobacteraceae bacterium]